MKKNNDVLEATLAELKKQISDNNKMFQSNIEKLYKNANLLEATTINESGNKVKEKTKQMIVRAMTPYIEAQGQINHLIGNLCEDMSRLNAIMAQQSFVQSQSEIGGAETRLRNLINASNESEIGYDTYIQFKEMMNNPLFDENREKTCIIQMVSEVKFGDAVGNDVMAINDVLKSEGHLTGVFVSKFDKKVNKRDVYSIKMLMNLKKDDVVIYHLASQDPLVEIIKELPCKVVLRYHNVTPPEFFAPYDAISQMVTENGLEQVKELKDYVDYGMVVSEFNKQDLIRMGYTCPIDVVPIVIPFDDYKKTPDKDVVKKYSDGITNILFVGRGAPNKKIEDVITAFATYKKNYDESARLFLVGNYDNSSKYKRVINDTIDKLQVKDVIFPGHISFAEILAYYSVADVFLCMSEHEGFCVPLLEAMSFNLPILAYECAAVPGTLGGAGELFSEKDYEDVAKRIDRLVHDEEYRKAIIEGQGKRLKDFEYANVRKEILDCVKKYQ